MKKRILIITMFYFFSFVAIFDTYANSSKSKITDPNSIYYYDNNLQENKTLSIAAKEFAAKNPEAAAEIVKKSGGECGIKCATAMAAAATTYTTTSIASSLSPLGAGSVGDSSVTTVDVVDPDTAMDEAAAVALEGVPSYEEAAAANQKALEESMKRPPDTSTDNILGIPNNDLRNGNVDMSTIPTVLVNIINVLLGVAGTVSIVSLIYYAVQMQINSGITGDSSGVDKTKKGMYGSVIGFVVAILAWFIVIRFIEILSGLS